MGGFIQLGVALLDLVVDVAHLKSSLGEAEGVAATGAASVEGKLQAAATSAANILARAKADALAASQLRMEAAARVAAIEREMADLTGDAWTAAYKRSKAASHEYALAAKMDAEAIAAQSSAASASTAANKALAGSKGGGMGMLGMLSAAGPYAAAAAVITSALKEVAHWQGENMKLSVESAKAYRDLASVVGDETAAALQEHGAQLQDALNVDGDAYLALAGKIHDMTGLTGDALQEAADTTLAWAAKTGHSVEQAAEEVGAGLNGVGRAFKRWGIEIDENASKQERLNAITKGSADGYNKLAAAAAAYEGQLGRLNKMVEDWREVLGDQFTKSESWVSMLHELGSAFQEMAKPENVGGLRDIADGMAELVKLVLALAQSPLGETIGALLGLANLTNPFVLLKEAAEGFRAIMAFLVGDMQGFHEHLEKSLEPIHHWLQSVGLEAPEAAEKMEEAAKDAGQGAQDLGDKVEESGQKAESAAAKFDVFGNAIDETNKRFDFLGHEITKVIDMWGEDITQGVQFTTDAVRKAADDQYDAWVKQKQEWDNLSFPDKLATDWQKAWDEQAKHMAEFTKKFEEEQEKQREKAQKTKDEIIAAYKGMPEEMQAWVLGPIEEEYGKTMDDLVAAYDRTHTTMEERMKRYALNAIGVTEEMEPILEAWQNAAPDEKAALESMYPYLQQYGNEYDKLTLTVSENSQRIIDNFKAEKKAAEDALKQMQKQHQELAQAYINATPSFRQFLQGTRDDWGALIQEWWDGLTPLQKLQYEHKKLMADAQADLHAYDKVWKQLSNDVDRFNEGVDRALGSNKKFTGGGPMTPDELEEKARWLMRQMNLGMGDLNFRKGIGGGRDGTVGDATFSAQQFQALQTARDWMEQAARMREELGELNKFLKNAKHGNPFMGGTDPTPGSSRTNPLFVETTGGVSNAEMAARGL